MPSYVPLKFPPGVFRNGTNYQSSGRYWDADLVRFFDSVLRPMGGWSKISTDQATGIPRGLLAWKDEDGDRWVALGTTEKLYVFAGGALVDITPIGLIPGLEDALSVDGYGGGAYGSGTYGGPRVLPDVTPASLWQFDTWGQYLVACMSGDGKLYQWKANPAQKAQLIDNAPVDCKGCFVTPERFLVAYGAGGNPRRVQWCSQSEIDVWEPTRLKTAGSQELQTNGILQAAAKHRGETVLFTEVDTWVMRYNGPPTNYGFERISKASGIAGPRAVVAVDRGMFWMGQKSFFYYDGVVSPLPSEVADHVFSDINVAQISKVYAGHSSAYSEVWWFYPSNGSNEIDRYVLYNYREGHWMIGQAIKRTAWEDQGVYDFPIAASSDGYLYAHEFGWTADGTAILSGRYITSGPVERPSGEIMHVTKLVPDERTSGEAKIKLYSKFAPEQSYVEHGPYALTDFTDVRFTGRQVSLEIQGNVDADWRFGTPRLQVSTGGRR
jgi:hypothetical protein